MNSFLQLYCFLIWLCVPVALISAIKTSLICTRLCKPKPRKSRIFVRRLKKPKFRGPMCYSLLILSGESNIYKINTFCAGLQNGPPKKHWFELRQINNGLVLSPFRLENPEILGPKCYNNTFLCLLGPNKITIERKNFGQLPDFLNSNIRILGSQQKFSVCPALNI